MKKKTYSTRSFELDLAVGKIDPTMQNLGIPARSIIEIFGAYNSIDYALFRSMEQVYLGKFEGKYWYYTLDRKFVYSCFGDDITQEDNPPTEVIKLAVEQLMEI